MGVGSNSGKSATYRHTNSTVFIISQYLAARSTISTLLRTSTFAMMWPTEMQNNKDAMYRAYGGMYKNQQDFEKHLRKCRKRKHSCLLYKANQPNLECTYTEIMAGDIPKGFKMLFGARDKQQQQQQQQQEQQQQAPVPIGLQNLPQYGQPQQQSQFQPQATQGLSYLQGLQQQQQPQMNYTNMYQSPSMNYGGGMGQYNGYNGYNGYNNNYSNPYNRQYGMNYTSLGSNLLSSYP